MKTDARTIGRAVAIAIACAAPVVMAAAQAMVIRDRVAIVHPAWPPWAVAAMAIGFELCILTAGLAIVVTGHRDKWLIGGELFLIAMSVAVAVTSALDLAPEVLSLTIALVPLQYMVAFYAAHALYTHWYAAEAVTVVPVAAPVKASQPAPKPATKPQGAAPRPAGATPAAPAVLAAKATVQATGKLPDGFSTQAALAKHLGIDPARVSEWKREIASANGASAGAGAGASGQGVG